MELSIDHASDKSRRMSRLWQNVQVKIICFFKQSCCNPVVDNVDCQVHEVDRLCWFHDCPLEAIPVVDFGLEFKEFLMVTCWVIRYPYCKDIINVLAEKK
eukprot:11007208-Ditylum_brightwellii.AAC.1